VDASKQKYGPGDLDALFADAGTIVVAKGKKVVRFEPKKATFDAEALRAVVIGPSGNLRAPTLRIGKTWLVGFSAETYAEKFGG
jgi:hypothetical protein